ncbi:hypothetical protein BIV23_08060 [Streptomyces monashensis]|uniref:Uncharacterized protein n=1 Tax=Streptomyces monashensis TaxID=1678012 RepID=A0A1S2QL29_9ACTN|nr:hypothetical protein BIV23_08060 [Streptomyces monashensis]
MLRAAARHDVAGAGHGDRARPDRFVAPPTADAGGQYVLADRGGPGERVENRRASGGGRGLQQAGQQVVGEEADLEGVSLPSAVTVCRSGAVIPALLTRTSR